ncbi:Katanin p60 ATPase-containing subunit A1 [Acorus gramineus]|uniref:Katanin p60 ATPase-containing subunit A1 n=1 Tax=Acorus gramineus TaxID=55184 RepID=A0AAV9A5M6_ACOGR|nr:Katanin p60 ATPase-containing subunit A1 [Acorus gramineus]
MEGSIAGYGGGATSSSAASGGDSCWRRDVDENLRRLHSLKFGADRALEAGDHASASILGLRLLGFLDSHDSDCGDRASVDRIRLDVAAGVSSARRSLAPDSDRGDIDLEKIKQSKYFKNVIESSKRNNVDKWIPESSTNGASVALRGSETCNAHQLPKEGKLESQNERSEVWTSKNMKQAKLTSMYGSNVLKPSNTSYRKLLKSENQEPEECVIVEKGHANSQRYARGGCSLVPLQVDEEENIHGNDLRRKRRQMEAISPGCENVGSQTGSEEDNADASGNGFVTARAKLEMDSRQRHGFMGSPNASLSPRSDYTSVGNRNYGVRSGGIPRRGLRGNFVPPIRSNGSSAAIVYGFCWSFVEEIKIHFVRYFFVPLVILDLELLCGPDGELPEKLRNLEPRLLEHVSNEIMDRDPNVRWDDIESQTALHYNVIIDPFILDILAGLEHAKKCVTEMVIWPLLRPDIFRGCRSPGKGLLLFGPPGTGKTMIGKAIAGEAKATFFYISASSLTSKWIGEGEKLVRALFGVASCRQPAVIFVDEIDSLLSQRKSEGEHESSRRLKTQFLIEMEGFDSGNEQILLIGATNRPQELDEAARRRLTKRLYIPLPSSEARAWIIRSLLEKDGLFKLSEEDMVSACKLTEGYSGSDMKNLVKDASMGPLREALRQGVEITKLKKEDMRPVTIQDFQDALQEVRPSVSPNELSTYEEWNNLFGSLSL